MKLKHSGKDYKSLVADLRKEGFQEELKNLKITDEKYLIPFNPVVNNCKPVRIAFFGLNAYCDDKDFEKFQKVANPKSYAAWCQEHYNAKWKIVLSLLRDGLPSNYMDEGAVYYSNLVKLVLRQKHYKSAYNVMRTLKKCPKIKSIFMQAFAEEVLALQENGCKLFVCFGNDAHAMARSSVASLKGVDIIKTRHFACYRKKDTKKLIEYATKKV